MPNNIQELEYVFFSHKVDRRSVAGAHISIVKKEKELLKEVKTIVKNSPSTCTQHGRLKCRSNHWSSQVWQTWLLDDWATSKVSA